MRNDIPSFIKSQNLIYFCNYHISLKTYRNKEIFAKTLVQEFMIDYFDSLEDVLDYSIQSVHFVGKGNVVQFEILCNPKIGIFKTMNKIKAETSRLLRSELAEFSNLNAIWQKEMLIQTVGDVNHNEILNFYMA